MFSIDGSIRVYGCGIVAGIGLLTACGSTGHGAASTTVSTANNLPAYAYVASQDSLSSYSIDPTTGGLTASGSAPLGFPTAHPVEFAGGISQIATDPSGQFLYVVDSSTGVYAYAINQTTGALTVIDGSPFAESVGPSSLAFDASGTHLFVAGITSPAAPVSTAITAYSIGSSGALTLQATYTIPGRLSTMVSTGNHLYVAGFDTNLITAFSIEPTGELIQNVPDSPVATDNLPFSIVAVESGAVLYTANYGVSTATQPAPGSICAFTINSSTGALTPVAGNPQAIAVNDTLSIDPAGKFLFVPEMAGLAIYAIDSSGALAAVDGSPFAAGTAPRILSVDPQDRFVYIANGGSVNVSEFSLDTAGFLTPTGSPVAAPSDPVRMATAP